MKKVLFVNPFGLGDVLFTFYAIAALKNAQPDIRIDLLCNERTIELVRMNPDIMRAYEFNRDHLRAVRSKSALGFFAEYKNLISEWKSERYDAMFDLSLGREFGFLGMMAGIGHRYGFDHRGRGLFLTNKIKFNGYEGRPVAQTQIELLRCADLPIPPALAPIRWNISKADEEKAAVLLKDARVRQWMALAPGGGQSWGANASYKQWAPEKFAEAANHWAQQSGGVLLLGDSSEKVLLDRVRGRLHAPYAVACGESLGVVASLLNRTRLFLGNDGGLMHLAHSLNVRTAAVFGPVDEMAYGPYGTEAPRAVVTQSVPCRPCYKNFHFPACPYDGRCLKELPVEKVLESIDKIA